MIIKKLLISLASIFIIFVSSLLIIYTLFIYKPENLVQFIDRFLLDEYKINYQDMSSESKLLELKLGFKNLLLENNASKEILKVEKIYLSIDFLRTFINRYLYLNALEIEGISSSNQTNSKATNSFKIRIGNLSIQTDDFIFQSNESYIININGNTSITNFNGKLNNIFFKNLKIFNRHDSTKFFYSGVFNFNEKVIQEENLIDLKNFSDYIINLNLESMGYFERETENLKSLNKYKFIDSKLITIDEYLINDINLILFTNLDDKLTGLFTSSLSDQDLKGSMLVENKRIVLRSILRYEMSELLDYSEYFALDGYEEFKSKIEIKDGKVSLELKTNSLNTNISSILKDLEKSRNERLDISIKIADLSRPTYFIKSDLYNSFVGEKNNGYFIFGNNSENVIKNNNPADGFHIYLNLIKLDVNELLIDGMDSDSDNLRSINLRIKDFDFFKNIYVNQNIKINLLDNGFNIIFSGQGLNGSIREDSTGFIRVDVYDTKFDFKGMDIIESQSNFNVENVNLRFVGKNIQAYDDTFQDIDFYLLRNEKITTIDNIKITSKNLNIGPYNNIDKAYISYNNITDMYKVRGSYELNNADYLFEDLINYNFEFLSTDLNIQWVSLEKLKNIEGNIKFLIKDFESKATLPDSTFLKALKIFNLNAIIENINNETSITSPNLYINRAEGNFYIGKNRALISNPIKVETSEAKMRWLGEVIKDSDGLLNELSLDLEMRLKVSENIPWYAAIFGGIPALAGGLFFENIFDERLDDVSTFKFKLSGSIEEPIIERLD